MPTSAACPSARKRCIRSIVVLALCTGALVLAPAPARANLVTFKFTGVVDFVMDQTNLLGGSVVIGTPITGTYTFESSTPDALVDVHFSSYRGAITDLGGILGAFPFFGPNASENKIGLGLLTSSHTYSAIAGATLGSQGITFSIALSGAPGMYDSDALPLQPPSLDGLNAKSIGFVAEDIGLNVHGELISLVLVPEPAFGPAVCLFGVALLRRHVRRGMRASLH